MRKERTENFETEKIAHGKNIRKWCRFLLNGKKKYAIQDVYETLPDICRPFAQCYGQEA